MSHSESWESSHTESCPDGRLSVLCRSLLLYERVERDVYRFGVEDIEITEVAKMAKITERVQGIWTTTRHVIQPVTKKAKISIKTTRHVMWRSLGGVAVK